MAELLTELPYCVYVLLSLRDGNFDIGFRVNTEKVDTLPTQLQQTPTRSL